MAMRAMCICCGHNLMFSFLATYCTTKLLHLKRSDGCRGMQTCGKGLLSFLDLDVSVMIFCLHCAALPRYVFSLLVRE